MSDLPELMEPHSAKCDGVMRPASILFGQFPAWTCECQWGQVTRRQFREMFGFRFRPLPKQHKRGYNVIEGDSYIFMESTNHGGNSKQRRARRRQ